jgi:hypothetical protein
MHGERTQAGGSGTLLDLCEMCGTKNVAIDDEDGYCPSCAREHVGYLTTRSDKARRTLTLMVDAALEGRIHPEDVRELVEERIAASAEQYWASPARELRERSREDDDEIKREAEDAGERGEMVRVLDTTGRGRVIYRRAGGES